MRMTRRSLVVLAVALGLASSACGGAPRYTVTQAVNDLPVYAHAGYVENRAHARCLAEFLFRSYSPGRVKSIVRGADFAETLPPEIAAAQPFCANVF